MADPNVDVTPGDGATIACDDVNDLELSGHVKVQYVKLMNGDVGDSHKAHVFESGALSVEGPFSYGNNAEARPFQIAGKVEVTLPLPKEHEAFSYPWLTERNQLMVAKTMPSQRWWESFRISGDNLPHLLKAGEGNTWLHITSMVWQNYAFHEQTLSLWENEPGAGGEKRFEIVLQTKERFQLTWQVEAPLASRVRGRSWWVQESGTQPVSQVWVWGYKWAETEVLPLEETDLVAINGNASHFSSGRDIPPEVPKQRRRGHSK